MYWFMSLLGVVLAISPFILGYSANSTALWTSIVLGVVLALPAGYKAVAKDEARWALQVAETAGVLAMLAPFLLGFTSDAAAKWANVYVGAVEACLAWGALFTSPTSGQTGSDSAVINRVEDDLASITQYPD